MIEIAIVVFLIISICILGYVTDKIGYVTDKKAWNNGVCPRCEKGFWRSFDMDSGGNIGYSCTHCDNTHWQNGYYNTKVKIKAAKR